LTAVPGHFYAPDVYQATTNANAGLLSVVPKLAGGIALLRLTGLGVISQASVGWQLIVLVSVLSMTLGNLAALWQTNLRRMMAYSSIAHAGYLLIGIAVTLGMGPLGQEGWFPGLGAVLLYLAVYSTATLGAFAVFSELSTEGGEISELRQLHGLVRRRPGLAGALAVSMFSLTGLPPLVGFWGKFELIGGALRLFARTPSTEENTWFLYLAIIAMLNAAIAATYYLRVVASAYFHSPSADGSTKLAPAAAGGGFGTSAIARKDQDSGDEFGAAGLAAALAAGLTLIVGCYPGPFVEHTRGIGESLLPPTHAVRGTDSLTSADDRPMGSLPQLSERVTSPF
jgi:NADH-quinone oxidoreductase subunit N